jgi:hypothetical protein
MSDRQMQAIDWLEKQQAKYKKRYSFAVSQQVVNVEELETAEEALQTIGYILDRMDGEMVPVAHARWEERYTSLVCSSCGSMYSEDIIYGNADWQAPAYCPNCGARMDLEED